MSTPSPSAARPPAAAAKFLPSLGPGEAAIIGVDFPIPLNIQIELPPENLRPSSSGPQFAKWLQPKQVVQPKPAGQAVTSVVASPKQPKAPPIKKVVPPPEDDDIPF